jgi:hypothetical protein
MILDRLDRVDGRHFRSVWGFLRFGQTMPYRSKAQELSRAVDGAEGQIAELDDVMLVVSLDDPEAG